MQGGKGRIPPLLLCSVLVWFRVLVILLLEVPEAEEISLRAQACDARSHIDRWENKRNPPFPQPHTVRYQSRVFLKGVWITASVSKDQSMLDTDK